MGVYDRAIATAKRLLAKWGAEVEIVVLEATLNPSQPWKATTQENPTSTSGVFLDYEQRDIDGTRVQTNDRRLLVPAVDFDSPPVVDGQVKVVLDSGDEQVWAIKNVSPLSPGGVDVLYELQVRR